MPYLWRVLAIFSLVALFVPSQASADAELEIVHEGSSRTLIVFVHGLWSDAKRAFSKDATWWPDLVANDQESIDGQSLSQYSVGVLNYSASRDTSLSLPEVTEHVLI